MLLHMMELKGRFNTKMIRKAKFSDLHFDEGAGVFLSVEKDRVTGAVRFSPCAYAVLCVTDAPRVGCDSQGHDY